MGGISHNVWLHGLCAGVLWFRQELRHSGIIPCYLKKNRVLVEICGGVFCLMPQRLTLAYYQIIRCSRNCFKNTCCCLQCSLLTPLPKIVRFLFCPVRLLSFTRLHHSVRDIFLPRFHSRMDMLAYSAVI
jgi:hypothetical protein